MFVKALNKDTGKEQVVPAHYVDNPALYGGVFTSASAPRKRASNTSRRSAGSVENNPAESPDDGTDTLPAPAGDQLEE